MSLKLQREVLLQPHLPSKWKHALTVLALIAKDDGTSIFASEATLAGYLGMHRVTTSRLLTELHRAGLVIVTRRGGRWRTGRGVERRSSERRIDIPNLRAYRCSSAATSSFDRVATPPNDGDLVATQLHAEADLVAASLRIKTGTTSKTGTEGIDRQEYSDNDCRMSAAVAGDDGDRPSRASGIARLADLKATQGRKRVPPL